jgi:hypothetical protein
MHARASTFGRFLLLALTLLGCGAPSSSQNQTEARLTAPIGDPSGCDQFGFAGTKTYTDWSTDCGIPGSNIVNADGKPVGQELQMVAWFNCHTRDSETWDERMEWDQCLNGAKPPSGSDPTIRYDYPGCHLVDGVCGFAQLPNDPYEVDASTPDGMLLRALAARLNDVRAQVKAQGGGTVADQLKLLDAAQLFADLADAAFVKKARALGVHTVGIGYRLADLAANFVPGVALGRDAIIVLTGVNPITGETLTDTERTMIAGALLVPGFLEGAAEALTDLGRAAEDVARSAKADAAIAGDLAGSMARSDEAVADLVHAVPCTSSRALPGHATPLTSPCGRVLGQLTGQLAAESEAVLGSLRSGEVSFGQAVRKDYNKTFFDSFGWELKSDVGQVHHAVPQQVQTLWPGLVSDAELHSLENLRGIPRGPDGFALHQGEINTKWNDFLSSYVESGRTPTRDELLSYALAIDNKYGMDFIPPIR